MVAEEEVEYEYVVYSISTGSCESSGACFVDEMGWENEGSEGRGRKRDRAEVEKHKGRQEMYREEHDMTPTVDTSSFPWRAAVGVPLESDEFNPDSDVGRRSPLPLPISPLPFPAYEVHSTGKVVGHEGEKYPTPFSWSPKERTPGRAPYTSYVPSYSEEWKWEGCGRPWKENDPPALVLPFSAFQSSPPSSQKEDPVILAAEGNKKGRKADPRAHHEVGHHLDQSRASLWYPLYLFPYLSPYVSDEQHVNAAAHHASCCGVGLLGEKDSICSSPPVTQENSISSVIPSVTVTTVILSPAPAFLMSVSRPVDVHSDPQDGEKAHEEATPQYGEQGRTPEEEERHDKPLRAIQKEEEMKNRKEIVRGEAKKNGTPTHRQKVMGGIPPGPCTLPDEPFLSLCLTPVISSHDAQLSFSCQASCTSEEQRRKEEEAKENKE